MTSIPPIHLVHAASEFALHADAHREQTLLAFVIGHLGDAGLLGIRTDAEKFIVLAVLNLVECIATP